ncbi:MAG: methylenetetrahydrofolate--tRNA-(uracil(54)-C(5))-methyltransferase (FADH(2)-oxidizing) TrmFO [Eggerthellaceae bacterium]|nr:methylenetetrahydrofolate--tRNA-(uracil(54)-C(5))-methyltransferase (FADH(2)-oxidizing) TrmFO [Eggerthellaceae bacterium]
MINIVGAGLAGSQSALFLADAGARVRLFEMRPGKQTMVHKGGNAAELVCSNSLKSTKSASAQGMLKRELEMLGSKVFEISKEHAVPAGGALVVDRDAFSAGVQQAIEEHSNIELVCGEVKTVDEAYNNCDACIIATGPLTSDKFADSISDLVGEEQLAFYDAVAPIVMADSLDMDTLFYQGRYDKNAESDSQGDYLNAPINKQEYYNFIAELLAGEKVIAKHFKTKELFQACQPIEEIARNGKDAPRFGPLKPVGLTDPRTGRRPWAALQLRAENREKTCFNMVGFQTNLTFPEQKRVFRMIPGMQNADFARFGVMHRNTFIDAPRLLNADLSLKSREYSTKLQIYFAGQITGTDGYVEAIRSGLHAGISCFANLHGKTLAPPSAKTAFGSLLAYATNPNTENYQPMHVNFGILQSLETPIRNKKERYEAYASRGKKEMEGYIKKLNIMLQSFEKESL